MNTRRVLEALKMQPLSEDEKKTRHILGRLYGPIATCNSGTRNGRKYNRDLWEKALSDDIFKEKIKNKSLFLELGHPVNREETDMEKVCACIPEMPKIVDGDLYAYVDILDTANGRLLKTLCDYGFVPGISSRGSGDVMPNNEVDPETFFLETWDIVQLPAVKDARLQMCEGLDVKSAKLKKALKESIDGCGSEKEKDGMKEALDNLDIELTEDEIPWSEDPDDALNEGADEIPWSEDADEDSSEIPLTEADEDELEAGGDEAEAEIEETDAEEPTETEAEGDVETEIEAEDEETEELVDVYKVKDLLNALDDYDEDAEVEFRPIEIDGEECPVTSLDFEDGEDGKLAITIGYYRETGDNIEEDEAEEEGAGDAADATDGEIELGDDDAEAEAGDAGDEGVIESLKETIRQKDLLENEVKALKREKAVGDAEVEELKESLGKYRDAFARTSEVAAKARSLENENKRLTERLSQSDREIESLKRKHDANLTESADKAERQLKSLRESLVEARAALDESDKRAAEQVAAYRKRLNEKAQLAADYKGKCDEVTAHYVSFRASMLGIKPTEITCRLEENYSIDDIDGVCEDILQESVAGVNKLPYGFDKGARVKITESKTAKPLTARKEGYDIDDSLLELAGLK